MARARVRALYDEDYDESAAPAVHFENVGVRYGMGPEVLRDLTFSIEPNSFQFLTGPSGAGKTTLLRLILLSVKPTRGLISLFGEDVSRISKDDLTGVRRRMGVVFQDFRLLEHLTTYENVALPLRVQGREEFPMLRRRVGIVFQDFRLLDHLTTYENVALPLRVRGKDESSYRADVLELLGWVGLGERINVLPPVLSGGEKQRAAIARALIDRPEILLADEPTGNVDPPMARRLLNLFLELNRLGTAVVIATHDLSLMDQVEARRMILSQGRLDIYE